MPAYTGPSPEQMAAEARAKAAEDAAKIAQKNTELMADMNRRLAEASKKRATQYNPVTKVQAAQGDVGGGLSNQARYAKRKRAVKASDLRIKLNPSALAVASTPSGTAGSTNV